jgi:hypothetical protein
MQFNCLTAILMLAFPILYLYVSIYSFGICTIIFDTDYCFVSYINYHILIVIGGVCICLLVGVFFICGRICTNYKKMMSRKNVY